MNDINEGKGRTPALHLFKCCRMIKYMNRSNTALVTSSWVFKMLVQMFACFDHFLSSLHFWLSSSFPAMSPPLTLSDLICSIINRVYLDLWLKYTVCKTICWLMGSLSRLYLLPYSWIHQLLITSEFHEPLPHQYSWFSCCDFVQVFSIQSQLLQVLCEIACYSK